METLHLNWKELCSHYCSNQLLIDDWFNKIRSNYSQKERHYHNLDHISSMLEEIQNSLMEQADKDILYFATWFHDIIYDAKSNINEAESAKQATIALQQLGVIPAISNKVAQLILSTAKHTGHTQGADLLLDFFLDCDLKILGTPSSIYQVYSKDIRKEYQHVLSFIYKKGRKKVLQQFLEASSIYRTSYFKEKYETQARYNITQEIENL